MTPSRPLVVTLAVDDAARRRWDALRTRYFPADRLVVGAHVTLFHAVPGEHLAAVLADVRAVAAATGPFAVAEGAPYSLGRGVALRVASPALLAVRADLAARWSPWLSRQDAQPFLPHVTVQNKVSPAVARETLSQLSDAGGGTATAEGIAVWHYDGGPWSHAATVRFGTVAETGSGVV